MDGHAKGGGALSAVAATKSPVIFLGTGEHMDEFEIFDVKPFVSRLLGFMDKIQEAVPRDQQPDLLKKLPEGTFTLRIMYEQFQNIPNMGPIGQVFSMLPGFSQKLMPKGREKESHTKTMMDSLTNEELDSTNLKLTNESRVMRIARGSGRPLRDVMEMLEEYKRLAKIWSKMKAISMLKKIGLQNLMKQMGSTKDMTVTMNDRTYKCVLGYRLGVALFPVSKSCSTCSRSFDGDLFGDHAVLCVGMVGIKHRHNLVRDTILDVCFRSGISAGKEVDIGLRDESDRSLRPANLLLYAWDRGQEVFVDLTGSSPLTRSGMMDFVPGQVVAKAVKRKCEKYRDLCAAKGYGFLPFSFSTLEELDADAVALLVRVRGFTLAQDAGARASHHIFSRISFAIAKGVGVRLVSRMPTNFV
ncbi:hypothetical protein OROGR_029009 [Orobanche gracilis]